MKLVNTRLSEGSNGIVARRGTPGAVDLLLIKHVTLDRNGGDYIGNIKNKNAIKIYVKIGFKIKEIFYINTRYQTMEWDMKA